MISISKLTSKGQVTLPKPVRQYLEVDRGDTIIFEMKDNYLIVRKSKSIEHYFNTLKPLKGDLKEKVAEEIARDAGKTE